MDLWEAMESRHSVRSYDGQKITGEVKAALSSFIRDCNEESGLHMQLVLDEPKGFDGLMAHYGKFVGVTNYLALIGPKGADLDEKCGYYGEKVVLKAQQLGLNSCWVGMTYSKVKSAFQIAAGEKLALVIAMGYGATQGSAHRSKPMEAVIDGEGDYPQWFKQGLQAALLAPTALNQQKFRFALHGGNQVSAKAGFGAFTKVDLGIAKYHFEIGAGKENFTWV